jgi:formylglycine-generating enzyme required for sulfatase activity
VDGSSHEVMVDTFQITQYPVTVAEFACALEAKAMKYNIQKEYKR